MLNPSLITHHNYWSGPTWKSWLEWKAIENPQPGKFQAMDADPGTVQHNKKYDEAALEVAERRFMSGQDDDEVKPHPVGCRCKSEDCVAALKKKETPMAKPAAKDRGSILRDMLKATASDAAYVRRSRLQAKKEERRQKASDAIVRQRAWDRAVAADERAFQKHQEAMDAEYHASLRMARQRWEGRDDMGMGPAKWEPSPTAEIGEITPGEVESASDPDAAYSAQVKREGERQRACFMQAPTPTSAQLPMSAYADLNTYTATAQRMRGGKG